jgi:hypothetical protein
MQVTDCLAQADGKLRSSVDEADGRFLSAFELCELPEDQWTHLAHVRVAWICLSLMTAAEALARIREGIRRYNTEVLHRRHKYHETVTVAFTRIVADRMRDGESWSRFSERIRDLLNSENTVLLLYYSRSRLFSDEARAGFVEPDLKELPPFDGN